MKRVTRAATRKSIRFDSTKPAVETFVGRSAMIAKLADGLRDGDSYSIVGPRKIGRSSLLIQLARRISTGTFNRLICVYVKCPRDLENRGVFFTHILEQTRVAVQTQAAAALGPAIMKVAQEEAARAGLHSAIRHLLEELASSGDPVRLMLLLDEMHRIEDSPLGVMMADALCRVVDDQVAQLIWCGHRAVPENDKHVSPLDLLLSEQITVSRLSKDETSQLVQLAEFDGASKAEHGFVQKLFEVTNGHPLGLQYFLHAMLSSGRGLTVEGLKDVHVPEVIAEILRPTEAAGLSVDATPATRDTCARVFISYSHDTDVHKGKVFDLAKRLRRDGIDAHIDQYEPFPLDGWFHWMSRQIRESRFVLFVCTEEYCEKGRKPNPSGTRSEFSLIENAWHETGMTGNKFIPIVLNHRDKRHVPDSFRQVNCYLVDKETEYQELLRRLLDDPATVPPPIGQPVRKGPSTS